MRLGAFASAVAAAAIPISVAGQPAPSYCDQKQFEALQSEARQCVQLGAIRRAINSTAGANDIAIAAVEDCAGEHSYLAMVDQECGKLMGGAWPATDWREDLRRTAITTVVEVRGRP